MITSEVSPATGTIGPNGTDAKAAGELPLVREVAPGKHEVTVEAKGYRSKTITAIAVEGELVPVEVDLEPLPATITLKVEGGARVTIDGRSAGTTPLAPVAVEAGRHFVTVTRRGRRAHAREVVLERGGAVTVATSLRTTTQRRASRWVMIGSGVLVVGAGLAGLGAWSADSEAADLDDRRQHGGISEAELRKYEDLRAERADLKTTMWTLGGAALAVGTAGALLYFLDRDEAEAPPASFAPTIAPTASPDGLGVMILGGF